MSTSASDVSRVPSRCALYGQCGGCQLQHLGYDDQLALKTEEIRRLYPDGTVAVEACIPSPTAYGYRSKLTPHFPRPRADRAPAIGFLRAEKRITIDVPACPIATPAVNARLAELRAEVFGRWASYKKGPPCWCARPLRASPSTRAPSSPSRLAI